MSTIRLLLTLGLMAACTTSPPKDDTGGGGGGDGGTADGGGADGGAETQDWCGVLAIIDASCVVCHAGPYASGYLDLSTDPHGALVGVDSALYAGQVLVVPSDPDASFLLAKLAGTHDSSTQGDVMPPGAALSADQVDIVRTWIANGATEECDDGGDGGTPADYHPEGYEDPSMHSMEAKLAVQTCTDCHGADLSGGSAGVSCDTCHTPDDPPAWRGDCTFCHGGVDTMNGAPPESIRDEDEDTAFGGAHTKHVTQNTHAPFDCTTCHVKPDDVLSPGHLWDGTAGDAEVVMSAGLSSAGTWNGAVMSCSNLYCHGNGQGDNGSVDVSDAPLACDDCHPDATSSESRWESMSGVHVDHLEEGVGCRDCHEATVGRDGTIATPSLHVNGTPDIDIEHDDTLTWNATAGTCNGSCHSEEHRNEPWVD